jgi:dihydrofolate synthase/folylpolyglutamate synthase
MRFATLDAWLVWQESLHPKSIDLGLERVRRVYEALALPPQPPFTITVGGTNGKGSSVALLEAMLRAQGYRVGAFTSPHLLRYNERICVDGAPVEDEAICAAFERIDQARGETTLSFFEFGALAALEIFSQAGLDVQILEVGLGGRLDAVNLLDADAALIASIDLDHQEWLGETRDAIALEKAGILRPGRPAVCSDPNPPMALLRYAMEQGIELACLGRDYDYCRYKGYWRWYSGNLHLEDLPLPNLRGEHQLLNAAAAIRLLLDIHAKLPVGEGAMREGLASAHLQGRLHFLEGKTPILLDVAHNPQSVRVLAEHLAVEFPGRRIHAVFAVMRDKDIAGVIQNIQAFIYDWRLAPLSLPRAAAVEELLELMRGMGVEQVLAGFASARAAFEDAVAQAQEGDLILVFGSFYLASEILAPIA